MINKTRTVNNTNGLSIADDAYVDAEAFSDREEGHNEDDEEKETLERTTSALANRSLVDPGGF